MLISLQSANGAVYPAQPATPNLIRDIPDGERIVRLIIDNGSERIDYTSDGSDVSIGFDAIRRLRGGKRAA